MDVRMPDGTIVTNVPDNITQEDLLSAYSSYTPEPISENPIYGVAANVTPSLATGIGSFMQLPGKLADLVTGTAPGEKAGGIRTLVGSLIPGGAKTVQEAGSGLESIGQAAKTLGLQQKEKERAERVERAEGQVSKFGTALAETITDPTLLSSFLFEQIPNTVGSWGFGLLGKAGFKALVAGASEQAAARAGLATAVGSGVAMQGTDIGYNTYKDIYERLIKEGMSPVEANTIASQKGVVAGLEGGALSYAASRIPGARELEKIAFRKASAPTGALGKAAIIKGGARGAAGETLGENIEEIGGQFASNIGKQEVFPETSLTGGLGEAGAMATIGGSTLGGGAGALNARAEGRAQQRLTEEAAIAEANAKRNAAVNEALKGLSETEDITTVQSPVPLNDPSLEFSASTEINGVKTYTYIKRTPKEVAVQPEPELFGSREPLPQDILDQGYRLVEQREEDGQPLYIYVKEEPAIPELVQEPAAKPVIETIAEPTTQPAAPELPLGAAPESAEQRALPPVAQPAQIAQPEIVQPVDPNVEARLAAEPIEPVAPSEPPPVAQKKVAKAAAPKAGEKILSAHEFIASLGGLNKQEAVEINPDAAKSNVRIGNKWLYASKGGLSAGQAAEKLAEAGYIQTEDNNEVYRVINDSLVDPVYSINDADAIAERKFAEQADEDAARFAKKEAEAGIEAQEISEEARAEQDELQTEESLRQFMLDSGYTQQDLNVVGFTKASPELKAEVVELERQMKVLGIDPSEIIANISFESKTDLEYYSRAKSELAKAITQAAKQGGRGDVSQANVPPPPAELTSPTEEELKAKQEAADKAAADKAKADRDADAKAKAEQDRKNIVARSEKAAGEYELGKTAEEDLSGQKDLLAIGKKVGILPALQKPADFVLKEGRIEEVVLAARALAAKKITKAEYDAYIDAYAPIATIPNPEPPLSTDGVKRVLKRNQVNQVNPKIKDGTRVGIRMDINALKRAIKIFNDTGEKVIGSVVSIHEGSDINTQGNIIGYSAAASIKNARFAIRNEQKAFKVAQGVENKSPQQTIEGEWVNISPEDAYARVKSLLKDPKWAQVSLDPLRHSFFYDRSNKRPVVSADEILQVGRFVLAKNVKYAERDQFLYSQRDFGKWSNDAPLVEAEDALNYDFKTGEPFVAKSYHGTNAAEDFTAFDVEKGGAQTAAESAGLGVFSTNSPVIAQNYAENIGFGRYLALNFKFPEELKNDPEVKRLQSAVDSAQKVSRDAFSLGVQNAKSKLIEQFKKAKLVNAVEDKAFSNMAMGMFREKDSGFYSKEDNDRIEAADKAVDAAQRALTDYIIDSETKKVPQRIMPLYVKMNNPKVYDAEGKTPAEFPLTERIEQAKREGHDGVVFKNIADPAPIAVHYVSFYPDKQIKSQFNTGSFSDQDNISYSISNVTQKDVDNANLVANATSSKIVYQDGNLGLFMKLSPVNGEPLYFAAKGASIVKTGGGVTLLDNVTTSTGIFTQAEIDSLKQARDKIEDTEYAKFASDNPIKIKDGVGFSPSVSPKLQGLLKEWKGLLKLDQDIYLATNQDILDNANKYSGPLRKMVGAADKGFSGITQELEGGSRYILVNGNLSEDDLVETLAHELGHAHEKSAYDNASPEMKAQLQTEFMKWLRSAKTKNAREFIDSLRSKESAKNTNIPDPLAPAKNTVNFYSYWATFSEWYADQTARWATTAEKPKSSVEKFFSKVAETLRNFFSFAKNKGFLPNETFAQYMDAITSPTAVANHIIAPEKKAEQLPLFSIGKLTQAPTVPSTGTPRMNVLGAPIAGTWTAAPETTLTPWIYKLQDKQVDLKDAQKQIEKTVGKIDDALNAYRKETLYYGRVADQTERFLTEELKPLLKDMIDKKISLDTVDKYLQALHAPERNTSIAKRVGGMPDGGAGISTADAQAYLASLSPQEKTDLQDISDRVRKIISGTQEIEVNGGLELQSKIDGWNKAWPNYVPLFRDEVDYVNSGSGMGQGFSTRGGSSKRAVGSDKPVKEIIASLAEQRQKAIVRSEKARVGKALYALAIANPNPDYWLAIDPNSKEDIKLVEQMLTDYGFDPGDIAQLIKNMAQEPRTGSVKRVFNPVTKQFDEVVKYDINTQNRYSSNVLPIRINGEDKFLFFNPSNERAKRMAESIKNLDAEQLGEGVQAIGNVTRFIAALSTQYNPIFGAINFARDVQGAMLNLSTTPIKDKKAAVMAGAFKAMRGIYKESRARRSGEKASSYYSDLYRDFESAGGKTGFINQFNKLDKKGSVVERELKGLTQGRVKGAVSFVGGWLSDYNDVLENAVRLSAYEQGLAKGLSKEESAEIAKNLTVNFNRKGAKTAWLGALYAFFNSSVQGTARLYETLRGPAGKKIIAGGFLLGAFQAALLAMAGFDEDEPSEFIKQKNFVIPTLDGGYIMIPMPLGFNVIPNVGRIISEIAFGSKKSGSRKIGDLMEVVLSSFNPLGSGNFTQMIMPTIGDPIANVMNNRDSFGRPISREDRAMNPSPGYLRSRESAGVVSKGIAEFLNYVSGGTEFNKGAFSPTGDDINYVVGQYLGGVGREVMRAKEFVSSIGKEEPFEPYKVPIIGKVYGDINAPASVANKFYLNVKQMAEHENEIKGRKGSAISEYMRDNPDSRLYRSANRLENEISKLNKTKTELLKRDVPEERIRRIEDQKLRMMKQFNDQVRKLQ